MFVSRTGARCARIALGIVTASVRMFKPKPIRTVVEDQSVFLADPKGPWVSDAGPHESHVDRIDLIGLIHQDPRAAHEP
jgi:hypothetical protein